jgi:predicted Zn-dependent protease
MKRFIWTTLAAALLAFPAFATPPGDYNLPQLGRAGAGAISQVKLDEMGHHFVVQLRRNDLILEDPLVSDYVRTIGHRIASASNRPDMDIHYFALRVPQINSFATPGKNVFIFTGLFLQTDNENELAGVIAHETAHVTQRHIARAAADSEGMGWKELAGILAGLVLAAETGNPQVGMAAAMGTQAALLQHRINFTRHEEAEADRVGIGFLARAGYDPRGMAQMFEKMEMLSRSSAKPPQFLMTHPLDVARITDARQRARDMKHVKHPSSRRYLLMRARARVLVSENIGNALAWFNGVDTKGLRQVGKNALAYGKALCLTRLHRVKKSLALLKPLLHQHSDVVAFHLAVARAELENDRAEKSLAALAHAEEVFPDSLAVKMAYANALLAAHRSKDAVAVLKNADSNAPDVVRLLAQASSEAGANGQSRYYMARYYAMNGRFGSAIKQMRLALNNPDINDYDRARYQSRLDDLKHSRKRQKRRGNARNQWHFGIRRGPASAFGHDLRHFPFFHREQ